MKKKKLLFRHKLKWRGIYGSRGDTSSPSKLHLELASKLTPKVHHLNYEGLCTIRSL